ncbi:MAG: DUF4272 domain-containing protein [Caulobacteraceae bacterium]
MSDELPPDLIRSADEVARRALALFSVVGLALGAERKLVLRWLRENELWSDLSPIELGFIDSSSPSRQQVINAGWWSERLVMLLWALGEVEEIPPSTEQCDTSEFQDVPPPFADVSVPAFIARAMLRPDAELIEMADLVLDLHWAARDAQLNNRAPRSPVDIEVIQERHHAINWVIGYEGQPWDEVTSDT